MKVTFRVLRLGPGWSDPLPRLDSPLTLVLAFGDSHRSDPSAWDELEAAFPTSVVIGCSTSGQILGPHLCDGGIVATVGVFEGTRLVKASAHVHSGLDSRAVGVHLGARLAAPDLRGVFVCPTGYTSMAVNLWVACWPRSATKSWSPAGLQAMPIVSAKPGCSTKANESPQRWASQWASTAKRLISARARVAAGWVFGPQCRGPRVGWATCCTTRRRTGTRVVPALPRRVGQQRR